MHIIKNCLVSKAFPGPINFSHQPNAGLASVEAAWDDADRPVCRSITLSFEGERDPQVSYAMSNDGRDDAEYVRGN